MLAATLVLTVARPALAEPGAAAGDSTQAAKPSSGALDSAQVVKSSDTALDSARVTEPIPASDTPHVTKSKAERKAARSPKFQPTTIDSTRRQPPTEPTGFDRPRWVMLRSLVLPGWGQAHNGSWTKAALVVGVEGLCIARVINDKRALNRLDDQISQAQDAGNAVAYADLVTQFNARSDRYIGHQWWLGAALAYSLVDAYIDAHFRNFRVDLEDDPALPPEERRAAGLKLSWQEHF